MNPNNPENPNSLVRSLKNQLNALATEFPEISVAEMCKILKCYISEKAMRISGFQCTPDKLKTGYSNYIIIFTICSLYSNSYQKLTLMENIVKRMHLYDFICTKKFIRNHVLVIDNYYLERHITPYAINFNEILFDVFKSYGCKSTNVNPIQKAKKQKDPEA